MVWSNFDDKRFKANFRITKGTFLYIFGEIEDLLTRETISEEPVHPRRVHCYRKMYIMRVHKITEKGVQNQRNPRT